MTEAILRDLKLVGTSSASGGRFRNIRVTGEAVLNGDTECAHFSCTGNFAIKGGLQAESVKFTGNCTIAADLRTSRMSAIGEADISGGIRAERLKIIGELKVSGICEAESVELSGVIQVGGLLNAEHLTLKMHGPCRAHEIGGGTVTVKRSRTAALKKMFSRHTDAELTADLIEGDTVNLEYTCVSVVRGNRVTIGPGCKIGRVEYRTELNVSKNAVVNERKHV